MPSTSKAQQHFMGMLYAHPGMAKEKGVNMSKDQLRDFAATKTKGLPGKIGDPKKRAANRKMLEK